MTDSVQGRENQGRENQGREREKRRGLFIQRLNAARIGRDGADVTLPGGMTRRAVVKGADTTILTGTEDDDAQQVVTVVFVFAGTDWGLVTENMVLTVGGAVTVTLPDGSRPSVDMSRPFKVAAPLHPRVHGGVVTEFAVDAYPDV